MTITPRVVSFATDAVPVPVHCGPVTVYPSTECEPLPAYVSAVVAPPLVVNSSNFQEPLVVVGKSDVSFVVSADVSTVIGPLFAVAVVVPFVEVSVYVALAPG